MAIIVAGSVLAIICLVVILGCILGLSGMGDQAIQKIQDKDPRTHWPKDIDY